MNKNLLERHFETPEALRHDALTLAEDARELVNATSEVADERISRARDRLAAALERGKQSCAQLQDRALEEVKRADQTVRTHPYETVLIAFGLGAVLGCMMARRR
jgi:ElaB/YqjD/DUF883 family membrane-anchored ribosome-binding protein